MKYKKIIAYIPETSVLFELDDGNAALVSIEDELITVSKYSESHLKFGGFESPDTIPQNFLKKAADILDKEENIYKCRDILHWSYWLFEKNVV